MKKKLLMRLAAAALAVGMCLSSAGAVKADSYYINDLGEDEYYQRLEEYQNRSGPYVDVSTSDWYCEAIEACKAAGYMNGYQDGTFRPKNKITRAECAAILSRIKSSGAQIYGVYIFSDISSDKWYANAVNDVGEVMGGIDVLTSNNNITNPDIALFHPNAMCTRIDFCQGIPNAIDYVNSGFYDGTTHYFTDYKKMSDYELWAISALYNAGIINGNPDGSFAPNSTITRAEVAQILYNYELRVWLHH